MSAMTFIEFGLDDMDNTMAKLSAREIDKLPFGAIQLDFSGKILSFNETESLLTGRKKESVIGRNFFDEVAPCCNKPGFRGVFDAGVRSGKLNAMFDYVFDYRMAPTRVKVHMKTALTGDSVWVFVRRV